MPPACSCRSCFSSVDTTTGHACFGVNTIGIHRSPLWRFLPCAFKPFVSRSQAEADAWMLSPSPGAKRVRVGWPALDCFYPRATIGLARVLQGVQNGRDLAHARCPPKPSNTTCSKKVRMSTLVPVAWADGLRWSLPLQILVRSAATELWAWSTLMRLRDAVATPSLQAIAWPYKLKILSFQRVFNPPIAGVAWPVSLHQLSFGEIFDQPIIRVV